MEKGIKKGKQEAALNMLLDGFPTSLIIKITALGFEDIGKLRESLDEK